MRMRFRFTPVPALLLLLVLTLWTGEALCAVHDTKQGEPVPEEAAAPGATGGQTEEMTDILDIRPPVTYGIDPRLLFLALALAAVLAGIAVLYLMRRRRKTAQQTPVLPPVPEDEVALDALRELESGAALPDREYYFRLTGILRQYLDLRYGTDTLEKTTEELMPLIREIGAEAGLRTSLLNLLRTADPVKFAAVPAGTARRKEDMAFALDFVRATRRRPEEGKQHVPV